jgi:hypothetical protein
LYLAFINKNEPIIVGNNTFTIHKKLIAKTISDIWLEKKLKINIEELTLIPSSEIKKLGMPKLKA